MKDLAAGQAFSNTHGHAGVESTIAYRHEIETGLLAAARLAFKAAWSAPANPDQLRLIPRVSHGLVGPRPALGDASSRPERLEHAHQLGVAHRMKMLGFVLEDHKFVSIAGALRTSEDVVDQAVSEFVQVLITQKLAPKHADADRLARCMALQQTDLWARASMQPKHEPIVVHLDGTLDSGDLKAARLAWLAWVDCRYGDHVALTMERSAMRFVQCLLDAGVQKSSLATVSDLSAAPLSAALLQFGLESHAPVKPHGSRPAHRIFLTEAGVPARTAAAASVSMVGVHWVFLALGSSLLSKGEI